MKSLINTVLLFLIVIIIVVLSLHAQIPDYQQLNNSNNVRGSCCILFKVVDDQHRPLHNATIFIYDPFQQLDAVATNEQGFAESCVLPENTTLSAEAWHGFYYGNFTNFYCPIDGQYFYMMLTITDKSNKLRR